MSLVISKVFTYDTDAGNYIQAVEGASGDNQALEPATRQAINDFVIGCKQDGIWNAIKASCILSGARTLNGALQPLVGTTAPTNVGNLFVQGDYNRKTGLVGDGTTKRLDSNRASNADPLGSSHLAFYSSEFATINPYPNYIGAGGQKNVGLDRTGTGFFFFNDYSGAVNSVSAATGFVGAGRNGSTRSVRANRITTSAAASGGSQTSATLNVFAGGTTAGEHSNARLAFYSIGESLDLALLDARVTALITAFGVAIP